MHVRRILEQLTVIPTLSVCLIVVGSDRCRSLSRLAFTCSRVAALDWSVFSVVTASCNEHIRKWSLMRKWTGRTNQTQILAVEWVHLQSVKQSGSSLKNWTILSKNQWHGQGKSFQTAIKWQNSLSKMKMKVIPASGNTNDPRYQYLQFEMALTGFSHMVQYQQRTLTRNDRLEEPKDRCPPIFMQAKQTALIAIIFFISSNLRGTCVIRLPKWFQDAGNIDHQWDKQYSMLITSDHNRNFHQFHPLEI